jgi:CMP/dCMP kinase
MVTGVLPPAVPIPSAAEGNRSVPLTGVIALDGPSGTGKSSVARILARRLGARYLDTGAMYRAITWAVLEEGIAADDADAVAALATGCGLEISTDPDDQWITVGGIQIDKVIRNAHVTAAVSPVSALPAVRAILVAAQRRLIGAGGIVVEGRDIGTAVAPGAELKVYLTASPVVRALRRARQEARTSPADLAATAESIRRRDEYDSTRPTSPLRPADDAVILDTSDLDEEQVVQRLVDMAIALSLWTPGGVVGDGSAPDDAVVDDAVVDDAAVDGSAPDGVVVDGVVVDGPAPDDAVVDDAVVDGAVVDGVAVDGDAAVGERDGS